MSTEAPAGSELTPAEKMAQSHADHHAYVSDVPDEDDAPTTNPSPPSWTPPVSAKAAGKQKESSGPAAGLDTQSHDLFPELGGKAKTSANAVPIWGARNGSNGHANDAPGSNGGPRLPLAAGRGATPAMSLPGRKVESVIVESQDILPRMKLKRPVPDTIADINRKSRANITMVPSSNGRFRFDATGPQDVAQQALRDLMRQIGVRTTTTVDIPQSSRAHVIGKQGSVIKALQERTGARINFPKLEESQSGAQVDDDDDSEITVSIEGDTVAAASARDEIMKIVNERSAKSSTKLRTIPPQLYPFLAGPSNSLVNKLASSSGVDIKVPAHQPYSQHPIPGPSTPGQLPEFNPALYDSPIQLTGDRAAVQRAKAELERRAAELRNKLKLEQFSVQRGRHQFIVGARGLPPDEFFDRTGCAILLPADEDDDVVTIIGPGNQVQEALETAMDLALGMQCSNLDVSRFHRDAPAGAATHANNVTRYLRNRQEIERIEKQYNTHINTPFSQHGALPWELYSRDGKNAIRAQSEISSIMSGHPPSRIDSIPVDPFFYQHLQRNITPQVQQSYGVYVVVPEQAEAGLPVLLVYEGPDCGQTPYQVPRSQPSPQDVKIFKQGLQDARRHILDLISKQEEITAVTIEVPLKFHDRLRRFIKREQEALADGTIPARVSSTGAKVTIRGPASAVTSLAAKVESFVAQEKEDEKERGFSLAFDFPQQHANQLIGRGGSNIRDLRDRFDVEIQVQNGTVELKGPKAKAEAAKSHILSLGRTWADETTLSMKVDPKFHRELIGAQGSQINRLQTRYNVQIFFPKSAKPEAEEGASGDAASDAGKARRPAQRPDEVIIRGPSRGVGEARDELFGLYQYLQDNSFTATVTVQQKQVPSLIGQGGAALEEIRQGSGAKIDIPAARDNETVEISIKGTKAQVAAAKKIIEEKRSVFNDTVIKTIDVDRKHHKALIGSGGSNLRQLVVNAGGSDDRRELARTIQFPKQDADGNTIKIEGRNSVVEKIVAAIQEKVSEWESQTTEVLDVPIEKHRSLIGRGGDAKRQLESQFTVSIDIPRQGDGKTGVKITGRPENVQKAIEHISAQVKEKQGETLQVPRSLHHGVSNGGQIFRRLRNDFDVTVDHAGQPLPAKPKATRANGGSLPLITDDAETAAGAHSWSVVQNSSDEDGEIPWVLRGSPENIEKAKKAIQTAIEQAQKSDTTGYLILPDPRTYRLVIGPGGSKVNAIRKASGCRITVPRDQAKDEAIEVVGSKDGVEKAKQLILEAVGSAE